MKQKSTIGIFGGGSWATAIVKVFNIKKQQVHWYLRNQKDAHFIRENRKHPRYLSTVSLDPSFIEFAASPEEILTSCSIIILAVPAAALFQIKCHAHLFLQKKILSTTKGIVPNTTLSPSQFLKQQFQIPESNLAILAGPCHAEEVAVQKNCVITIASQNTELAKHFGQLFESPFIKTNISGDLVGVEYSFIIKNIIAIACGVASGLNMGDNFQAILVSNGMCEIAELVNKVSPSSNRNLLDSAYLGDLLVTTYSQFSRNRTLGIMLAKGYHIKSSMLELKMVAEGYHTAKGIHNFAKTIQANLPICQAIYRILYEQSHASEEFTILKGKMH